MPDPKKPRRRSPSQRPQFQAQKARDSGQRQVGNRDQRQRFLIVCEGQQTEKNYFDSFEAPGLVVDVTGAGRNTLSLVDEAIRLRTEKNSVYDQCWCVFDRDSFPADNFNSAIQKAEAAGFQVAYSNEAFELWYLLHFHDHESQLGREQYKAKLTDCLGYTYHKNSLMMYEALLHRQEQAIQRAEHLLATYQPDHNPQRDNPSTTVHLLVKQLRNSARP